MTGGTRRQAATLAVLIAALAVVLYLRRDAAVPASGAVPASNPAAGAAPGTPAAAAGQDEVADVRLEVLRADRDDLAAPDRNPFRFGQRDLEPETPPDVPAPPPQAVVPPAPAGPPPPPPIPLKFIGVLEAPTRIGTVAILSDSRGNVFYGKEGDIIEGRYRVLKIGTESAEVAYVDGRGRQTIRLSGQ